MDEAANAKVGVSRRTFLTTSAAIGLGATVATSTGVRSASAAPLGTGSAMVGGGPPPPPPGCGSVNSGDFLWKSVKDATVANPGAGNRVVEPQPQPTTAFTQLYAVRHGGDKPSSAFDQLLVPTRRISGIECETLWQPDMLNLWKYAWIEATGVLPTAEENIVVGVNSQKARRLNQLHIHLSRLYAGTRKSLDGVGGLPTQLADWTKPKANVELAIDDPNRTSAHFRVVHLDALLPNLFATLHQAVGAKGMAAQMIAVTKAPKGFYVISSESGLPHGGTSTCDGLFHM
ncbi:CDP-diacylglycerol diphosphatase [Gordonia hankookensis]|uniref:CDP-diacylglycerol diphosphatase n=1 Tax=Gordonia hankookensis TaxID=589403 RepID=A0ABR7W8L5_9ACTN|nr:CDP-diacylglycerol diphosphatase [Gordonia hankookensis]MBD1318856.1 CDP-diacylglycerol diphosphatase [Gordonia hankookensis]